jgi:predicted metal-dependent HD superfamily phosphohydrolase
MDDAGLHAGDARICWDTVERVMIRTTESGPWLEDAFWVFITRSGTFEVPNGALQGGGIDLLHRHLPGIDDLAIIRAMGSTSDAWFRVFERLASRTDAAALDPRLAALCARLGGRAADEPRRRLLAAWQEPHRAYHGLRHLVECLDALDACPQPGDAAAVAKLALWFHDAVYDPRATDNEERSAAWLLDFAREAGLPARVAERAATLVRLTAHAATGAPCEGRDADLVHDADLAILAADPFRLSEYEDAVRREYAHVGTIPFALGRGALLAGLLSAPAIYRTPEFRARHEERARRNLSSLLQTPRYRAYRWLRVWRWLPGTSPRA